MWQTTFFLLALAAHRATAQFIPVDYAENIEDKEAWEARIVSGWEAQPGQHPHQVSIRMVNSVGTVAGCGGNVVHREWLITSAHCTASQVTVVVRAGVTHMTRPEMMLETTEIYNYPTFDETRPGVVQPNDISLVKLPRPLVYSKNLRPIRIQLPSDAHRNYDEEIVVASGFGRTWTNGVQAQELRWVYLRGVTNAACASLFGTGVVTENTVCARFFNVTSQSICQGDSGGPLVHLSPEGVPFLIGVSSFVAGGSFGCHSGLPGAFVRPGPFHSWFTEITGIDFTNLKEEEEDTTTIAPSTLPETTPTDPPTTIVYTTTTATPDLPETTTTVTTPTSTTSTSTTPTPTTTPPTTTEAPESEEDDSEEIDDPELEDLLKRLEVKVRVHVKLSKYLKKRNQESIE